MKASIVFSIGRCLFQSGVARLALDEGIDCIIFEGNPRYITTWVAATLARLKGKRVLFWTHGWLQEERGLKRLVRNTFYKLAHGLLLYGRHARELGIKAGFSSDRLHVVYNSVDYDSQKRFRFILSGGDPGATRMELFGTRDTPIVICCARLIASCRFDLLLAAQAKLRGRGHIVTVLLVGDGPERDRLEERARRATLPVCFYGACHDEEVLARLFLASSVTVCPGKVGLTAIHSLGYGVPVISHDNRANHGPECEAIVPGRTGGLFREEDLEDLARVMHLWTQNVQPEAEIRAACYSVVERYYNPRSQARAVTRAALGDPPDLQVLSQPLLQELSTYEGTGYGMRTNNSQMKEVIARAPDRCKWLDKENTTS